MPGFSFALFARPVGGVSAENCRETRELLVGDDGLEPPTSSV